MNKEEVSTKAEYVDPFWLHIAGFGIQTKASAAIERLAHSLSISTGYLVVDRGRLANR